LGVVSSFFSYFISVFIRVFSFVHISDRSACYSRDYHCSFVLSVFWFLLLLESYIYIWIALISWFYLVLVLVAQEPQEGDDERCERVRILIVFGFFFTINQFLQVL
jgi:Ca2+/Na+ antiporter